MIAEYRTVSGDTWDIIAKKIYGDEMQAGFLMENNWEQLETVIFPGNVIIKCPELVIKEVDALPPWRK